MSLLNDRQITISIGTSRKDINWKPKAVMLSDLYERLRTPQRGLETLDDYFKLKKAQQDDLKDVGGFVGGTISGGRRKSNSVIGRDIITLDFDSIPAFGTEGLIQSLESIGYGYCVYSTRKHVENAPRLRIIVPLDRTVSAEEYEAIARRMASYIGIQMADPTTFEPSRLMYWPSCCADSNFYYAVKDAPFAPATALLETYTNWNDWNEWPQVPGTVSYQHLAVKQGDPESKPGIVGAFNRVCAERGGIEYAMQTYLPGIYEPCANNSDRYTFTLGSTTGGAVLYDGGKFLFSHHATDPCGGKLVNCFDLVRLHKFGNLDDDAVADTPSNRLPSYKAMCDFALTDSSVSTLLVKERCEQASMDFQGCVTTETTAENTASKSEAVSTDWMSRLKLNQNGAPFPTIDNILIIISNDTQLKDKFSFNDFAGRTEVFRPLPWNADGKRRMWSDADIDGLYWYLESVYQITRRNNIDSAFNIYVTTHAFNEVQDYIKGLQWDGVPRLDTLFINYLGADDTEYNRAVCRKAFTAAVARALDPGCKFDNMVILCGEQGIGKSTMIAKMSHGWFTDQVKTFEGKEAAEIIQGVWLAEISELEAFNKSDVSRIKQFLSTTADRYRAAYGRTVTEFQRRCVFFGTSNYTDFLRDMTGNRRFWPVDVYSGQRTKSVFTDLTDEVIAQVWAEAKMRWQMGEQLFLTGDVEKQAVEKQELHREATPSEGIIQDFVSKQIPSDWAKWSLDHRRDFWSGAAQGTFELVDRDHITAIEIWCELYMKPMGDIKRNDSRDINTILANLNGWSHVPTVFRCGPYSVQRGFVKDGK